MLMDPTGNLSSFLKPHGLLQKDLLWIHPLYLALLVKLHIPEMSHLTPTTNSSKIRKVKYLPDLLELTAGTVHL